VELSVEEVLAMLSTGDVEVLGLLPYSSNYVFLSRLGSEENALAIYKPSKGERPLWDFPDNTLAAREVAAFRVSEAGGWGFVPPTVFRDDAPLGPGSLQLFIDHDPERHYFTLMEDGLDRFEEFVTFDIVVNNADRKSGHVLEAKDGRLWAVDHGLTFNAEPKLRTVIWELGGRSLSDRARVQLEDVAKQLAPGGSLRSELAELLSEEEAEATERRALDLLENGVFPEPTSRYHLPWPLV
jgi:Phosphatidylinositol 3- and 4-kinase